MNKAVKESLRARKLISQKIIKRALRGAANPITIEEIRILQVQGVLDLEVFYENIGSIFPFILDKVSEGMSIRAIQRYIGMNDRSLQELLQRYPRLNEEVKKARRIQVDRNHDLIDIFS